MSRTKMTEDADRVLDVADLTHEQTQRILKWHKAILDNYISRGEVRQAIGEDEELPKDIEERVYMVPTRNAFRATLRSKLGIQDE